MLQIPTILENTSAGPIALDINSRLLQNRIVMLNDEISDDLAGIVIAELLYLEKADPSKDIIMYINSPGGIISAGLGIYDTMQYIKCDVSTVCTGMAASMGAFLLAGGTKGKRLALPNSEVMIHQPSGGAVGKETDISIAARNIQKTRNRMTELMCKFTGKDFTTMSRDIENDYWMFAEEALEYGIIDEILTHS